jgi:hypothetical protein
VQVFLRFHQEPLLIALLDRHIKAAKILQHVYRAKRMRAKLHALAMFAIEERRKKEEHRRMIELEAIRRQQAVNGFPFPFFLQLFDMNRSKRVFCSFKPSGQLK